MLNFLLKFVQPTPFWTNTETGATFPRDIGDKLFDALTDFTTDQFDAGKALSLGLEIQEIEKDWTWKKNNIHQILKDES